MPTITFSLADLCTLLGRNISLEELEKLSEFAKAELEGYDQETDEVKMNFEDTNLPYLWSVEGFSVLLKGILGIAKGTPQVNVMRSDERIIVDPSINHIRPFIAAFTAKGKKVDDYLLKQIVQLQEKFCDSYGRKREKVSIGVYSHKRIKFPVYYKAVDPESVEFIPLGFQRAMTLGEIIETHPTGIKYASLLKTFDKYPFFVDSDKQALSFPPIINSDSLGKIVVGDDDLFIEVTGTDINAVDLCANILATAFGERGFKIYCCNIDYGTNTVRTPNLKTDKIVITKKEIISLVGVDMNDSDIKRFSEMTRYGFSKCMKGYEIEVPCYRADILHSCDVIEDLAIMAGFNNLPETALTSYTPGGTSEFIEFVDRIRGILVGLGLQEVMSPVLSNKSDLYDKMAIPDLGTVEITEFMSETYSVVRSWLIPIVVKVLSQNRHNEYPQYIFEQGICASRRGSEIKEFERISVALCGPDSDITKIKQILDCVLSGIGLSYKVEESEHGSFVPGRVGSISVDGADLAYFGELHPKVLENWEIEMPIAAFELDLTELYALLKGHRKV